MTSINTNIAAQTALRTLQATNSQLDSTQSRISTGLKIAEAKDNAAYWSISTTLKSDSRSLSTVQDALSLGAATVDTAYQGTNQAREVLEEIQNKIILASGNSADKDALQAEIEQLQENLKAIAGSTGFSGENWLSINSGVDGYSADKSVVSSFNRQASGAIVLDTIQIDAADFALINGDAATSGILDGGKTGNTSTGGLAPMNAAVTGEAAVTQADATSGGFTTGAINLTGLADGDTLTFDISVDGGASGAIAAPIAITTADLVDLDAFAAKITAGLTGVTVTASGTSLVFTSDTDGDASNVSVQDFVVERAGAPITPTPATGLANATGVAGRDAVVAADAEAATTTFATAFPAEGMTFDADDTLTFNIAVGGAAAVPVTINRATVVAAGFATGEIATSAEFATVLNQAFTDAGINAGVVASDNAGSIALTTVAEGANASIQVTGPAASSGVNILNIDVSSATAGQLDGFRTAVVEALGKLTDNAAKLGAISKRIELQDTFVSKLIDTIDKGVSGLIDADMNEESTRLQALQVKQQLGVQALSIANQSAQNVLRLFQ